MQILNDKASQISFGYVLQNLFAYEPVLAPTRWLVNYSISLPITTTLAINQAKWHVHYNSVGERQSTNSALIASSLSHVLRSQSFVDLQVAPLCAWSIRQNFTTDALSETIIWCLPAAKVLFNWTFLPSSFKTAIAQDQVIKSAASMIEESLRSDQTK